MIEVEINGLRRELGDPDLEGINTPEDLKKAVLEGDSFCCEAIIGEPQMIELPYYGKTRFVWRATLYKGDKDHFVLFQEGRHWSREKRIPLSKWEEVFENPQKVWDETANKAVLA